MSLQIYSGKLKAQKEKGVQVLALDVVRSTKVGRMHGQVVIGLPWREYSVEKKARNCWDLMCRCGCDQPVEQSECEKETVHAGREVWGSLLGHERAVEAADLHREEKFPRRGEPYVTVGLGFRTVSLERMWELDRSSKSLEAK